MEGGLWRRGAAGGGAAGRAARMGRSLPPSAWAAVGQGCGGARRRGRGRGVAALENRGFPGTRCPSVPAGLAGARPGPRNGGSGLRRAQWQSGPAGAYTSWRRRGSRSLGLGCGGWKEQTCETRDWDVPAFRRCYVCV